MTSTANSRLAVDDRELQRRRRELEQQMERIYAPPLPDVAPGDPVCVDGALRMRVFRVGIPVSTDAIPNVALVTERVWEKAVWGRPVGLRDLMIVPLNVLEITGAPLRFRRHIGWTVG